MGQLVFTAFSLLEVCIDERSIQSEYGVVRTSSVQKWMNKTTPFDSSSVTGFQAVFNCFTSGAQHKLHASIGAERKLISNHSFDMKGIFFYAKENMEKVLASRNFQWLNFCI